MQSLLPVHLTMSMSTKLTEAMKNSMSELMVRPRLPVFLLINTTNLQGNSIRIKMMTEKFC